MVDFGEESVCAGCKPVYVQKLKEGVTTTIRPKQDGKEKHIEPGTWFNRIWYFQTFILTPLLLLAYSLDFHTQYLFWFVLQPNILLAMGLSAYRTLLLKRINKFRNHLAAINSSGMTITELGKSKSYAWEDLSGYRDHKVVTKAVSVFDHRRRRVFAFRTNSDEGKQFQSGLAEHLPKSLSPREAESGAHTCSLHPGHMRGRTPKRLRRNSCTPYTFAQFDVLMGACARV